MPKYARQAFVREAPLSNVARADRRLRRYLSISRTGMKKRMSLLSAPDEFVRPALSVAVLAVQGIFPLLPNNGYFFLSLSKHEELVHLFDHLKGETDVGHFAGLVVPYQFHFAPLIVKEHKAVFVGEGLIRSMSLSISRFSLSVSFIHNILCVWSGAGYVRGLTLCFSHVSSVGWKHLLCLLHHFSTFR